MNHVVIIGIAAAVVAACKTGHLSLCTENAAVTTDIVDTTANTAAIWDTTASDTTYLGSWWINDRPVMQYYGVVRSYHPHGTAAIIRLLRNDFRDGWFELGMIYVTHQGNIVAVRENLGIISAKWRCIQPIPGDSIHKGCSELSLPNSVALAKDPTACEDMFK